MLLSHARVMHETSIVSFLLCSIFSCSHHHFKIQHKILDIQFLHLHLEDALFKMTCNKGTWDRSPNNGSQRVVGSH